MWRLVARKALIHFVYKPDLLIADVKNFGFDDDEFTRQQFTTISCRLVHRGHRSVLFLEIGNCETEHAKHLDRSFIKFRGISAHSCGP